MKYKIIRNSNTLNAYCHEADQINIVFVFKLLKFKNLLIASRDPSETNWLEDVLVDSDCSFSLIY